MRGHFADHVALFSLIYNLVRLGDYEVILNSNDRGYSLVLSDLVSIMSICSQIDVVIVHLPSTALCQQYTGMLLTLMCSFIIREYRQPAMVAFSFKIYDNDTYGLGCQGFNFQLTHNGLFCERQLTFAMGQPHPRVHNEVTQRLKSSDTHCGFAGRSVPLGFETRDEFAHSRQLKKPPGA